MCACIFALLISYYYHVFFNQLVTSRQTNETTNDLLRFHKCCQLVLWQTHTEDCTAPGIASVFGWLVYFWSCDCFHTSPCSLKEGVLLLLFKWRMNMVHMQKMTSICHSSKRYRSLLISQYLRLSIQCFKCKHMITQINRHYCPGAYQNFSWRLITGKGWSVEGLMEVWTSIHLE